MRRNNKIENEQQQLKLERSAMEAYQAQLMEPFKNKTRFVMKYYAGLGKSVKENKLESEET